MFTRRQLTNGALSAAATALSGCASWVKPLTFFCPNDPRISNPHTPLTIDVHAHVFNGTDIPVERFITLVHGIPALGEVLQQVSWPVVPTGAEEIAVLRGINQQLSDGCGPNEFQRIHATHRSDQHRLGVQQLQQALKNVEARPSALISTTRQGKEVSDAIRSLSEDYGVYRLRKKSISGGSMRAVVDFLLQQFQYRYVNVFDFLMEYSAGQSRKIDLMVCHFLDFDWPLANRRQTLTPIWDQIAVMEQISILTGGRVHYYVPFDPMKQVAHDFLGRPTQSPMDFVQNAMSRGCIGVKMYPPMGFAPSGNASKGPNFWNRWWLPDEISQDKDFGKRLDIVLSRLYSWCLMNDVPIMAHTSPSEGPCLDFKNLTEARYWKNVPAGLRVNFGHFGNTEIAQGKTDKTSLYVALMNSGGHGANFYANSAYLSHAMSSERDLTDALRKLFEMKKGALLAHRLMYGSDWEMLIIEGNASKNYLSIFERIFSKLGQDPVPGTPGSAQFFEFNAANYLSLRAGSATRGRLDAFYSTRGIPKPQWAAKVDDPSANTHMRVSQVPH